MTQIHHIRKLYFEEGMTISDIAKATNHDRKTIRAKLNMDDWNQEIPVIDQDKKDYPSLEPFKEIITHWIEEDKHRKRKQRHTATRIYNRLKQEFPDTFCLSYRTVAGFVATVKEKVFGQKQQSALPLEHNAGEAQSDFGDAEFYLDDKQYQGKYLNLSFPQSNQGYLQLFKGENQQCLFEGMSAIFDHIGGVPPKVWFDNTKTIVTKILKGGNRNLTDDFLRFQAHYQFEAVFCNANAGHEKGSVETKVRYHRNNMLVPIPRIKDLDALSATRTQTEIITERMKPLSLFMKQISKLCCRCHTLF